MRVGGASRGETRCDSDFRGIVVESAAALSRSALQTQGSGYCVAHWGRPGRLKQSNRKHQEGSLTSAKYTDGAKHKLSVLLLNNGSVELLNITFKYRRSSINSTII